MLIIDGVKYKEHRPKDEKELAVSLVFILPTTLPIRIPKYRPLGIVKGLGIGNFMYHLHIILPKGR